MGNIIQFPTNKSNKSVAERTNEIQTKVDDALVFLFEVVKDNPKTAFYLSSALLGIANALQEYQEICPPEQRKQKTGVKHGKTN